MTDYPDPLCGGAFIQTGSLIEKFTVAAEEKICATTLIERSV